MFACFLPLFWNQSKAHIRESFKPVLAMSVRTYYPPGDHRKSHFQIEIADFSGHIRTITHTNSDCSDVYWLNSHTLLFTEGDQRLVKFDLITKKQSIIAKGNFFLDMNSNSSVNSRKDEAFYDILVGDKIFPKWAILDQKLIKLPSGYMLKEPDTFGPNEITGKGWKLINLANSDGDSLGSEIQIGSNVYPLDLSAICGYLQRVINYQNRVYIISCGHNSTTGSTNQLSVLNVDKHSLKSVFCHSQIDFEFGKEVWAWGDYRALTDYGPQKAVWTGEVGFYDFKTGKSRTIVSGLKDVRNIAINPSAP